MRLPDLAAAWAHQRLALIEVDAAALLRLTRYPGSEPHWGKAARYRFDDPAGAFGVTYAAFELAVAFAETLLHEQGCFVQSRWVIEQARVEERHIVRYARPGGTPLRLADLTGAGLKRLGLNNDLCASDDYTASMRVAAAVHAQVPAADGIVYVSRQLNNRAGRGAFRAQRRALRRGSRAVVRSPGLCGVVRCVWRGAAAQHGAAMGFRSALSATWRNGQPAQESHYRQCRRWLQSTTRSARAIGLCRDGTARTDCHHRPRAA